MRKLRRAADEAERQQAGFILTPTSQSAKEGKESFGRRRLYGAHGLPPTGAHVLLQDPDTVQKPPDNIFIILGLRSTR